MIIVLVRTIIIYLLVLFVIRVMGKSELSAMQPFQLVVTLMIADLAVIPIGSSDTSLFNGISALVALLFIQVLVSYLTLKSDRIRTIICGKPSNVIENGILDMDELKNLRISVQELKEQLRTKGYPFMEDVDYAIVETNGDLSVIPKEKKRPVSMEDLNPYPSSHHLKNYLCHSKEDK